MHVCLFCYFMRHSTEPVLHKYDNCAYLVYETNIDILNLLHGNSKFFHVFLQCEVQKCQYEENVEVRNLQFKSGFAESQFDRTFFVSCH